jgi:hypothetical protein
MPLLLVGHVLTLAQDHNNWPSSLSCLLDDLSGVCEANCHNDYTKGKENMS